MEKMKAVITHNTLLGIRIRQKYSDDYYCNVHSSSDACILLYYH